MIPEIAFYYKPANLENYTKDIETIKKDIDLHDYFVIYPTTFDLNNVEHLTFKNSGF